MPTPAALLALLTACGPPALPPLEAGPVAVSVHLAEKRVETGEPVLATLRVASAEGWVVSSPTVAVDGLEVKEHSPPASTLDGTRTVATRVLALQGPDGSYVLDVPPIEARGPTGESQTLDPPALFFDLGVHGPSSRVAEFETAPEDTAPVAAWAALASLLLAGALALGWWVWRRRPSVEAEPLTPEEEARQRWAAAKARADAGELDDPGLALALSTVFRAWLEATLAFPASARTTREILGFLDQNHLLAGDDRTRSQRLLTATDRLKFAREGGGDSFFSTLEADLEAVLVARESALAAEQEADDAVPTEASGA